MDKFQDFLKASGREKAQRQSLPRTHAEVKTTLQAKMLFTDLKWEWTLKEWTLYDFPQLSAHEATFPNHKLPVKWPGSGATSERKENSTCKTKKSLRWILAPEPISPCEPRQDFFWVPSVNLNKMGQQSPIKLWWELNGSICKPPTILAKQDAGFQ